MKRFFAMLLAAMLVFALLPMSALAATETVTTFADLKTAIADPSVDIIELGASFSFDEKLTVDRAVTIDGKGYTLTRAAAYTESLLHVTPTGDLTLKNLTIDGNNNWALDQAGVDAALADITIQSNVGAYYTPEAGKPIATAIMIPVQGKLTTDGVTIRNHAGASGAGVLSLGATIGGVASAENASILLKNTTIEHCATLGSSTVVKINGSTSVMTIDAGTKILNNYGFGNGAVSRIDNGKIIINGGEIRGNITVDGNASVFMAYGAGSTIEINGGVISGNIALPGETNARCSTLYVHSQGNFKMTGGTVSDNVGNRTGGILVRAAASGVEISGGTFTGNVARYNDFKAYPDINGYDGAPIEISGGTFSQDVSEYLEAGSGLWLNPKTGLYEAMPENMIPDPIPEDASIPETGDGMGLFLFAGLLLLSLLGMAATRRARG